LTAHDVAQQFLGFLDSALEIADRIDATAVEIAQSEPLGDVALA
jgi:hypothetical protein